MDTTEWAENDDYGGGTVVELPGGRSGVCRGVDPSEMYHTKYCDGRMSLALMIAMLVLGFVTVLVNLGVIIRTVKIVRQGHDKPAFYFIGNLALSDFSVGLFVVIAFLLHITNKSDLWQQKTCMLQIGVAVTACQETIFTIVLISVDKYLYICHGLHYSAMVTRKRVYGALVLSWCLAILVGSLPALGLHETWQAACERCVFAQVISTTFAIIFFVTSVAVPLTVVVALYSILLVLAVRMHKARYGGSYTGKESARSSNFRLSFMSKRSRSTSSSSKLSLSTTISSASSPSLSKASRRRTRRREMEDYKRELKRRDVGVPGGGGVVISPLAKISESAELIDRRNGADGGVGDGVTRSPSRSGDGRCRDENGVYENDLPSPGVSAATGEDGTRGGEAGERVTPERASNPAGEKQGREIQHPDDNGIRREERSRGFEEGKDEGMESEDDKHRDDPEKVSMPFSDAKSDEETKESINRGSEERQCEETESGQQKIQNMTGKDPISFNGIKTDEETEDDEITSETDMQKAVIEPGMQQRQETPIEKFPVPLNGVRIEDPASSPEVPYIITTDEDGTTTDEGEGEGKRGGKGGWRALLPTKYMNHVMVETRDKVLFLKKCRAVKTVLLILVSFTATYVPFVVGSLVYSAQQEKRPCLLHLLNTLLYCGVVANSLANPLIYAYGYREFRLKSERFKGVFAREMKRGHN